VRRVDQLELEQVHEVIHVEHVAHLLPAAAVADVAERAAAQVAQEPVREYALVDLPHLPRARDHPAAVDHRRYPMRLLVLGHEQLSRQLRGAVERASAGQREGLRDAGCRSARQRLLVAPRVAGVALLPPERLERRHGIDAAGGQEDHLRTAPRRQLEAVVGAHQVGVEDEARVASDTREYGWLGGALDERVELAHRVQVLGVAHVAVDEPDTGSTQTRQIQLRTTPVKVVERDDRPVGMALSEAQRQARPHEPRAAGDEDRRHTLDDQCSTLWSWMSRSVSSMFQLRSQSG
jgi:hypothetical protein